MDEKLFDQLLESVKQADKIFKGEENDCRAYQVEVPAANHDENSELRCIIETSKPNEE